MFLEPLAALAMRTQRCRSRALESLHGTRGGWHWVSLGRFTPCFHLYSWRTDGISPRKVGMDKYRTNTGAT